LVDHLKLSVFISADLLNLLVEHITFQLFGDFSHPDNLAILTSLRILQMFSLFWDRPTYTYYTYDPFCLHQRQHQRARYLNYLENQIASLFNDEFADFYGEPQSNKSIPPSDAGMKPSGTENVDKPQQTDKSEQVDKTDKPDAVSKPAPDKQLTTPRRYQYFSSRTFNGEDYVSEHRERVVSSNGEVHVRSRRQLGDRWHEVETHTDSEGKNTERETWHNVPDEQIEQFKVEWSDRHERPRNPPVQQDVPKPECLKDSSEPPKND
jgi:hypothetical protein